VRRSFRFALVAAALLIVTEALTLVLAAPTVAVGEPPVLSYPVRGWQAGPITTRINTPVGGSRLIQSYTSTATGDRASVETRCWSEPKDFLKWTGRLAYEGAGYEQVGGRAVDRLPTPAGALVSDVLMRDPNGRVVILYGYIDHWGVHAETLALWPQAIADLVARRAGPYCGLAVAVPVTVTGGQRRAIDDARDLARAFLARLDRFVRG